MQKLLNTSGTKHKNETYKRSPCAVGIFTTGNRDGIAFCNETHCDSRDKWDAMEVGLIQQDLQKLIAKVRLSESLSKQDKLYAEQVYEYASQFLDTYGIGTPTTCAY